MRQLTTEELIQETIYRLRLRKIKGRLSNDIVGLVAEMIELAQERVPECYQQQTKRED